MRSPLMVAVFPLLLSGCAGKPVTRTTDPEPLIVTVREDFDLPDPGDAWRFRTPSLWRVAVEGDRRFLQMAVPPERPMLPGVRRPQEYALYIAWEFRSFSLSCRLRLDRDVSVKARDACIIFGRRDETHFYYVHLSSISDGTHNSIMRVDGETRQQLVPDSRSIPPAIADRAWHKVDVLRDVDAGTIKVFVDAYDASTPALFSIIDRTYDWGFIALGSFDDHASFTRIIIDGQARKPQISIPGEPALPRG